MFRRTTLAAAAAVLALLTSGGVALAAGGSSSSGRLRGRGHVEHSLECRHHPGSLELHFEPQREGMEPELPAVRNRR